MANNGNISKKEAAKIVQEMKTFTKKISSSAVTAREFLQKTGISTPSGALKAQYK